VSFIIIFGTLLLPVLWAKRLLNVVVWTVCVMLASCSARRATSRDSSGRQRNMSAVAAIESQENAEYLKGVVSFRHWYFVYIKTSFEWPRIRFVENGHSLWVVLQWRVGYWAHGTSTVPVVSAHFRTLCWLEWEWMWRECEYIFTMTFPFSSLYFQLCFMYMRQTQWRQRLRNEKI